MIICRKHLALSLAISLAFSANAHETVLETIEVSDKLEEGESTSYKATTTRVGKVLQDPHDIPQAVTTLTLPLLEEQQVGSLKEALRNVAGISFNAAEGGRSGDNMNLRGFYTFGDLYLDGIRDTAQYYRETFNFEQIDVLRGAGAMLFGRGQAGGVINMVSKTPKSFEQYKLTASVGSYDYREVTADLNRPLSSSTAVRVNLMQRHEGSWRSNPFNSAEPEIDRKGAALSLALNRDSNNRFWINYYYVETDDNPDYGVSFDPDTRKPSVRELVAGRKTASLFWGTDKTFDKSMTSITTLVNEYRFSAVSALRTQLRVADYERTYWAKTPNLSNPPAANGWTGGNPTRISDYETVTLQSDFTTKFTTVGMQHEFLAGFEYLIENSYRKALQNFGGTTSDNPPDFRPYQASLMGNPVRFRGDSYAVYVQDAIEFIPRWKTTLGVRYDRLNATYLSATSPKLDYDEFSYRAALSYHPDIETHYYLAWSDSFSPTADLYQLTVQPQPPERSDVVEIGAKWLLMDGDLALRAAIYRSTKHWERNTDLESTAAILTKKRRTDGIEFEVAGRVTDDWEIFAGLALMDAVILDTAENVNPNTGAITKGNPEYLGKRARNTPKYTLNLWTTYKLGGGWKIGGGVEAKGNRHAFLPNSAGPVPTLNGRYHPNTVPAYARWDAMIAYEQTKWAVRLNIKNVFDKLYWNDVYDNGAFAVPGPRRTVILTTEVKL